MVTELLQNVILRESSLFDPTGGSREDPTQRFLFDLPQSSQSAHNLLPLGILSKTNVCNCLIITAAGGGS